MTEKSNVSPSPLSVDDLRDMPMAEVFKLVKHIQDQCNLAIKDVNTYSQNMDVIQKYFKDNIKA